MKIKICSGHIDKMSTIQSSYQCAFKALVVQVLYSIRQEQSMIESHLIMLLDFVSGVPENGKTSLVDHEEIKDVLEFKNAFREFVHLKRVFLERFHYTGFYVISIYISFQYPVLSYNSSNVNQKIKWVWPY